jgi:hypothetical protein
MIIAWNNDLFCGEVCQARMSAAGRKHVDRPVQVVNQLLEDDVDMEDASYPPRRHERRHDGGGSARQACPRGTRPAGNGTCLGRPYAVEAPPPSPTARRYYNSDLDNGWVERRCIANCR